MTWRNEFRTTSNAYYSNVREGKQLQHQINRITTTTVKNVKKLEEEILSLRKELFENKQKSVTNSDIQRDYVYEKTEGRNVGTGKTSDITKVKKNIEVPIQRQRRHSVATTAKEIQATQNRIGNFTNQVASARYSSHEDLQTGNQFDSKVLPNRRSLLSPGYSPNQLRSKQKLNSYQGSKKSYEDQTLPFPLNRQRRHSLSLDQKFSTGVSNFHSRPKSSFPSLNNKWDRPHTPMCVTTNRLGSGDPRLVRRRFSLPNASCVQNFARLSVSENREKKLTAKLSVSEFNAHCKKMAHKAIKTSEEKIPTPVMEQDNDDATEKLSEAKGPSEGKEEDTAKSQKNEKEQNNGDERAEKTKSNECDEDLFYAFRDESGVIKELNPNEPNAELSAIPKITLAEKMEKFFSNYPNEVETFDPDLYRFLALKTA